MTGRTARRVTLSQEENVQPGTHSWPFADNQQGLWTPVGICETLNGFM